MKTICYDTMTEHYFPTQTHPELEPPPSHIDYSKLILMQYSVLVKTFANVVRYLTPNWKM